MCASASSTDAHSARGDTGASGAFQCTTADVGGAAALGLGADGCRRPAPPASTTPDAGRPRRTTTARPSRAAATRSAARPQSRTTTGGSAARPPLHRGPQGPGAEPRIAQLVPVDDPAPRRDEGAHRHPPIVPQWRGDRAPVHRTRGEPGHRAPLVEEPRGRRPDGPHRLRRMCPDSALSAGMLRSSRHSPKFVTLREGGPRMLRQPGRPQGPDRRCAPSGPGKCPGTEPPGHGSPRPGKALGTEAPGHRSPGRSPPPAGVKRPRRSEGDGVSMGEGSSGPRRRPVELGRTGFSARRSRAYVESYSRISAMTSPYSRSRRQARSPHAGRMPPGPRCRPCRSRSHGRSRAPARVRASPRRRTVRRRGPGRRHPR